MSPTSDVPWLVEGDLPGDDDLLARLGCLGSTPVDPCVSAGHLRAIARQSSTRRRRRRAALAGMAGAGFLLTSTGLAAAGILPAPAQTAVEQTLGHIGVELPAARGPEAIVRPGRVADQRPVAHDDGRPGSAGHGPGRPDADRREGAATAPRPGPVRSTPALSAPSRSGPGRPGANGPLPDHPPAASGSSAGSGAAGGSGPVSHGPPAGSSVGSGAAGGSGPVSHGPPAGSSVGSGAAGGSGPVSHGPPAGSSVGSGAAGGSAQQRGPAGAVAP